MNAGAEVEVDDDLNSYWFWCGAERIRFGANQTIQVELDGKLVLMQPRDVLAMFNEGHEIKLSYVGEFSDKTRITAGTVNRSFGLGRHMELKYVEGGDEQTLIFVEDVELVAVRADDEERKLELVRLTELSADWEVNIPTPMMVASNVGKSVAPDLTFHRITEIALRETKA